jgi:hypothetical protein
MPTADEMFTALTDSDIDIYNTMDMDNDIISYIDSDIYLLKDVVVAAPAPAAVGMGMGTGMGMGMGTINKEEVPTYDGNDDDATPAKTETNTNINLKREIAARIRTIAMRN